MKQFDYKEFLKENKSTFHSSLNEDASSTAQKFAQHMSKKEGKKFTVTPGSVDEKSFDLDVDGLKYEGGSYLVKDNGDIVNVAMSNKVFGNVNQLEEGDLMKNIGKGLDYEATEEMIRDYASGLFGDTYEPEDLADFYLQKPSAFPKSLDYEFFKNNYDDILSLAMTGLDEGEAAYEYEKGKKAGEKITKSDLKAKIKEMIVAEQGKKVKKVDFLAEIEDMLGEESKFDTVKKVRIAGFIKALDALVDEYHAELYLSDDLFAAIEMAKKAAMDAINLNEAEGDEEVDVDIEAADTTTVDISTDEVDPNVKAVQDALTQAQAAAQDLNDPKLSDQIGNTITFFTRSHIVKKPGGAVTESMFPMLKKILK